MTILTIRTDNPMAEVGLYSNGDQLAYTSWQAHRELSATIHIKIAEILKSSGKTWSDIGGVAIYRGPGSFTGLRIGFAVANTIANELNVPIVSSAAEDWIVDCLAQLKSGKNQKIAVPDYGRPARTTNPKK
jgi:tRNA threonylcarbamoyladenosine biosynthesis protein TsaB